ncbi:LysE family translocator [Jiangella mangrovi]|uniref:Threonine/homoserine/homoserine lactone efflux protein n=1 Tax=Jiangella mangrovi TaxID=1524084 RepID=A0A7W9GTB7_9ACTN|nr:LysE family translocator [Jiangella mangrovi]MBB5789675.1 threonine/homoserine/homoserine lactone efflux protein [Jiangella mangrovi]
MPTRRDLAVSPLPGIGAGCLAWGVAAAGAVYLVGLGAHLLWSSFRRQDGSDDAVSGPDGVPDVDRGSLWVSWLTGLGTNILNPKIGVFYVATIPQFIPDGTSPLLMGILLAVVHNLIGMAWFAFVITGAGFMARTLGRSRFARVADRVTGVVLVGFGLRLALQHR